MRGTRTLRTLRTRWLLAGALVLAAFAGCGNDESTDEPVATIERFLDAMEAGDATAACDELAEPTLADLEAAGSCEAIFTDGFALLGDEGVDIPDYEITDASVDGDEAEATLISGATDDTLHLVCEDSGWKLEGTTALNQFHPDTPLSGAVPTDDQ